jgi:hypothetical protein
MRFFLVALLICCAFVTACGKGMGNGTGVGLTSDAGGDGGCALAPDAAMAAAPDASLTLGEPCQNSDQCLSGLCFNFNARGPHCSAPCTDACQCPPPTRGCNNMGVCKSP